MLRQNLANVYGFTFVVICIYHLFEVFDRMSYFGVILMIVQTGVIHSINCLRWTHLQLLEQIIQADVLSVADARSD